jgi:hypothetical protein
MGSERLRIDAALTNAEAPYEVSISEGRLAKTGEFLTWMNDNGTGRCVVRAFRTPADTGLTGTGLGVVRFTDEDTAFWFKVRFA